MAASEHTPHMQLSQFGPDDRPSWIDDYNQDMRTIDTALTQGGSQDEPLFCTAQVGVEDFATSMGTPYIANFSGHNGNIAVDYNTHTIPITKSGYYAVSGNARVSGMQLDSGSDKTLTLWIGKYPTSDIKDFSVVSVFAKSYETSEAHDLGMVQSCSITPIIAHFNAGDAVTMLIAPKSDATLHGYTDVMYLTLESKKFDNNDAN